MASLSAGRVLEPPHFVAGSQPTATSRRSLRLLLQATAICFYDNKTILNIGGAIP